jgi:hypothetical protein
VGGFVKQPELFGAGGKQQGPERLYGGRYKTVEELETGYTNARKFIGENGKFSRESLEGYMKDQGWYQPATAPEEYGRFEQAMAEVNLDHRDEAGVKRAAEHFRATNQTQEQAEANLKFFGKEVQNAILGHDQQIAKKLQEAGVIWDRGALEKSLQNTWGPQWEARGEAIVGHMRANPYLAQLMPLLAHREVGWQLMDHLWSRSQDSQPIRGQGVGPEQMMKLRDRIKEIVASPEFTDPFHHRHKEAEAEWKELCARLGEIKAQQRQ